MEKRQLIWPYIYFYLVCFSTLIIMIFGSIKLVGSIADLVIPMPPPVTGLPEMAVHFKDLQQQGLNISWEDYKAEKEKEQAQHQAWEQARARRSLVVSLAAVLIPLPIFLFHWCFIRKNLMV